MTTQRFRKYYNTVVAEDFVILQNAQTIFSLPHLESATWNSSSKRFLTEQSDALSALAVAFVSQHKKCCTTQARKSIAAWNLRKSNLLGYKSTLRHEVLASILEKLLVFHNSRAYTAKIHATRGSRIDRSRTSETKDTSQELIVTYFTKTYRNALNLLAISQRTPCLAWCGSGAQNSHLFLKLARSLASHSLAAAFADRTAGRAADKVQERVPLPISQNTRNARRDQVSGAKRAVRSNSVEVVNFQENKQSHPFTMGCSDRVLVPELKGSNALGESALTTHSHLGGGLGGFSLTIMLQSCDQNKNKWKSIPDVALLAGATPVCSQFKKYFFAAQATSKSTQGDTPVRETQLWKKCSITHRHELFFTAFQLPFSP